MAERLVVRNSPLKHALLLLFCLVSLLLIFWGEALIGAVPEPGWEWIRWPAALAFAYIAALAVRGLFDRRPQIVIDRDGIYLRRWSEQIIPWTAIRACRARKIYESGSLFFYRRQICLDLHDRSLYPRTARGGFPIGSTRYLGCGDVAMKSVGLDEEVPDLMAAIRPHAAAAGVEMARP